MRSRWVLPLAAASLVVLAGLEWVTGAYPLGILLDSAAATISLHTPAAAAADGLGVPAVPGTPRVVVPVPPGAQPVPPQPGMSWSAGSNGIPYDKVGFSPTYRVPVGVHATEAWVASELGGLGYTQIGSFSGSSNVDAPAPYTVYQREFVRPLGVGQPPAMLVVNVRSLGKAASLLRYVASVLEEPPRPGRTYVTRPVRSVAISEALLGPGPRRISRRITNPTVIARIRRAANALSTVTTAPFLCPAISYTIRLTLVTAGGPVSIVDMDNCGAVSVNGVWFLDPQQRFDRALSGLGLVGVGR